MTKEYLGGSSSIAISREFKERRRYLQDIRSMSVSTIDTLYHKSLYGHFDRGGHIIQPSAPTVSFGDYAPGVEGLTYVVELFNEFRDFYFNIITSNNLGIPKEIEDLAPTRSFLSLEEEYSLNRTMTSDLLYSEISGRAFAGGLLPLESFVELVNEALFSSAMAPRKITKSGFSLTDCYFTGLYVDMSKNYSMHMDEEKGKLINDPHFKCYADFCESHGFLVDINAPWRLVLNLESPVVKRNILNERPLEDFHNLYSDLYSIRVGHDDYWEIKTFYEFMYNQYVREYASRPNQTGLRRPTEAPSSIRHAANWKTKLWIKCLIINKLRELGQMSEPGETREYHEIYEKCIDMLDNNAIYSKGEVGLLTSPSGPIGYLNQVFATRANEIVRK